MTCECGHNEDAHMHNGCVDWNAREKKRCTCTEYLPASFKPVETRPGAKGKRDFPDIGFASHEELPTPTLEQCENVAVALGFPILIEGLRPSYYEESMRNLHKLIQRTALGDMDAAAALARLRAAFGHVMMPDDETRSDNLR